MDVLAYIFNLTICLTRYEKYADTHYHLINANTLSPHVSSRVSGNVSGNVSAKFLHLSTITAPTPTPTISPTSPRTPASSNIGLSAAMDMIELLDAAVVGCDKHACLSLDMEERCTRRCCSEYCCLQVNHNLALQLNHNLALQLNHKSCLTVKS